MIFIRLSKQLKKQQLTLVGAVYTCVLSGQQEVAREKMLGEEHIMLEIGSNSGSVAVRSCEVT